MALPPAGEEAMASGSGGSAAPQAAKAEEPASGGPEAGPASGGPEEAGPASGGPRPVPLVRKAGGAATSAHGSSSGAASSAGRTDESGTLKDDESDISILFPPGRYRPELPKSDVVTYCTFCKKAPAFAFIPYVTGPTGSMGLCKRCLRAYMAHPYPEGKCDDPYPPPRNAFGVRPVPCAQNENAAADDSSPAKRRRK